MFSGKQCIHAAMTFVSYIQATGQISYVDKCLINIKVSINIKDGSKMRRKRNAGGEKNEIKLPFKAQSALRKNASIKFELFYQKKAHADSHIHKHCLSFCEAKL